MESREALSANWDTAGARNNKKVADTVGASLGEKLSFAIPRRSNQVPIWAK